MKKFNVITTTLFIAVTLFLLTSSAIAGDEDTSIANVLLDNEKVRVVENIRHPGTLAPMHTHKAYIAYFFNACKIMNTSPDGKTTVKDIPAGKLVWSDGVTHEVKVVGNTDLHTLHIEFKE